MLPERLSADEWLVSGVADAHGSPVIDLVNDPDWLPGVGAWAVGIFISPPKGNP